MESGTHRIAEAGARTRRRLPAAAALMLAVSSGACGDLQRQGQGSSYLLVNALEAASGSDPTAFGGNLLSDVLTVVDNVPGIYNDLGRVRLALALKDPGPASAPTVPTTANFITINQYRVRYMRADGRNTQGVDVPYSFDGALTVTIGDGEVAAAFTLVRITAKQEAPLRALAVNAVFISTIAEVTFYGHDQSGREVSATAKMMIDFGNYVDKDAS